MIRLAVLFLLIALVAAVFGFTGVAVASAEFARIVFGIFLVLFIASLIFGSVQGRPHDVV